MIQDNDALLQKMIKMQNKTSELFKPGPYWENNTICAIREIGKKGIIEFRSYSNNAGLSFTDSPYVDIRSQYNIGIRRILYFLTTKVPFISKVFDASVKNNIDAFKGKIKSESMELLRNPQVIDALDNLVIPVDSIRGGCESITKIGEVNHSNIYVEQATYINEISKQIDLNTVRQFMELGGGFGVHLHLLLTNFKNIKKVIYVDISPNLYIATEYLRSFYGTSVKDCTTIKSKFSFTSDDKLEIYCILPNQIEFFTGVIEYFYNSHSFVEMPEQVIENYATIIQKIANKDFFNIALVTYNTGNEMSDKTFNHLRLPEFFNKSFVTQDSVFPSNSESAITYFIAKG